MNERERFSAVIQGISNYDPEQLRRRDLGELSFEQSFPLFQQIHTFFNRIKGVNWGDVTLINLTNRVSMMEALLNNFNQIRDARLDAALPDYRTTLQRNVATGFANIYQELAPVAGFELVYSGLASIREADENARLDILTRVNSQLSTLEQKAKKLQEDFEASLKTLESEGTRAKAIVEQVEANAKLVGITNEATHFKNLAIEYGKGADRWLNTSMVMVGLLIAYLIWISYTPVKEKVRSQTGAATVVSDSGKTSERSSVELVALIEAVLPRFIVVTILLTGLLFALRNYAAQRHNQVVNLHRQTALSSFQTFVSSTADKAIKDTILIQATQAIYAPQPSGYLKAENEVSQLPQLSIIADLVRGGSSKPDK